MHVAVWIAAGINVVGGPVRSLFGADIASGMWTIGHQRQP